MKRPKYRVKRTTDLDNMFLYIPQHFKFMMYWDFWDTNFPPHRMGFRSYEEAVAFIERQKKRPQDKFYYL
jgi:hypothetical protein